MKRKNSLCMVMILTTALVGGCGNKEAEVVRRFSTIDFEGYKLPGRIEQAKETGFKDCKASYRSFHCTRTGDATLLGVKALSSALLLEHRDYFLNGGSYKSELQPDQRAPEKLTYGSISFVFPETQYDERCATKKRMDSWSKPIECRKADAGSDYLKHKLSEAGWLMRAWKIHRYYFKEDQLVTIHIDRDGKTVNLTPISKRERDSEIQRIKQKISDDQAQQATQDDVLKKLKD
jgi:hypothetical protein